MSPDIDIYSLKAVCNAGFRVTVDKGNIIRMVPLEVDRVNYTFGVRMSFNCKNHNASGLFNAGSTSAATVMLYDDKGGPLSKLTKIGPNQVALQAAHTYDIQTRAAKDPQCTYLYNVTSGCVLGAKPLSPAPSPSSCPPGHTTKIGRFSLTFCTPCRSGTFSPGGRTATTCTPCPIGTANENRGAAECTACETGWFAPRAGSVYCKYCGTSSTDWTDGRTRCGKCVAGSTVSEANRSQCVRCNAGKKCCTVNWGKDCPQCTDNTTSSSYTSVFALESASPASCLATDNARCAPKINITIDGTCQISISSIERREFCAFASSLPIQGAAVHALKDLSVLRAAYEFSPWYGRAPSMADGNVTAVSAPYLDITVKTEKCTYRYRALTKPAAAILGAAPKAAPSTPCPAGSYRDTTTDTPPGPCLPCPPGTYSPKAGSRTCTACPAGTYAGKYGSTGCTRCPLGRISKAGASQCTFCTFRKFANPDRRTCSSCPQDTTISPFASSEGTGACLGTIYGSACCAAGVCDKQVRCGSAKLTPLKPGAGLPFYSLFRVKSRSVSSPTCKSAAYLSCLGVGYRLVALTRDPASFTLSSAAAGIKCATNLSVPFPSIGGVFAATNRGLFATVGAASSPAVAYELLTNPATRTFTVYLSRNPSISAGPSAPAIVKQCSATFELLSGYFLDLKPPTATCPAAALPFMSGGRTQCRYCGAGRVKTSKGACKWCPKGTFQLQIDGNTCTPCPRGHSCPEEGALPKPCSNGSYSPNRGLASKCLTCPAGTFSGSGANIACTKCPAGTSAPKGSAACGVPWQTKF